VIPKPLYRINLMSSERDELEQLARGYTTPQLIARRARIILMANEEGMSNTEIARELGVNKAKVTLWTQRWSERALEPVSDRLSDLPRPGAPDSITPEQWCRVMALACESPQEYGYPMSHWSSNELAAEAIKQGIVERFSAGHLRTVLQKKNAAAPSHPLLAQRQARCSYGRAYRRHLHPVSGSSAAARRIGYEHR
jgi:putative transposase